MRNTRFLPLCCLLGAALLWGLSFAAMKVALRGFSPNAVVWTRMTIASVCMLCCLRLWVKNAHYRAGDWKYLLLMVLFQPCLYFLLESRALVYTSAGQAGMISALVPLMVAAAARIFLGEPLPGRTLAGLVTAFAGVAGLTLAGAPSAGGPDPMLGNTLELAAMACAAGYMIAVKHLSVRYGAWFLTALQCFAGAVFFVPGAFELPAMDPGVLASLPFMGVLYLGIFASLGAFGLYNMGMGMVPSASAASTINLVPLISAAGGCILLGETLSSAQIAASALILAGVFISQGGMFGARRRARA